MSIKEMTLLDVIELSNRMDAASRDVFCMRRLKAGAEGVSKILPVPGLVPPGHHPVSAASWARSSRSPGVDCTCCDRSFASSAVARDRRAA